MKTMNTNYVRSLLLTLLWFFPIISSFLPQIDLFSFGFQFTVTPKQQPQRQPSWKRRISSLSSTDLSLSSSSSSSSEASFDFSSPIEWDNYYSTNNNDNTTTKKTDDNDTHNNDNNVIMEWHSSIPLETIVSVIPLTTSCYRQECLMIGCGNSKLPYVIDTTMDHPPNITLLDTSQTCLKQLKEKYGHQHLTFKYICGDASNLVELFDESSYDIIIDKGLTDAILCGEGWDFLLPKILKGAAFVLNDDEGKYILISYKLPKSTQQYIIEVCPKIKWEFDLPQISNDKVSISIGTKQKMS